MRRHLAYLASLRLLRHRYPIFLVFKNQLSSFPRLKGKIRQSEVLQLEVLEKMSDQLNETNPENIL